MTNETRAGGLAARARGWLERHPEARARLGPLIQGRPWDSYLDRGAAEIEALRRRYPAERVRRARDVLGQGPSRRKPRRVLEDLLEQVYRAHYSSLKIGASWAAAIRGAVAHAHLLGHLDAERVEAWLAPETDREIVRQTEAAALQTVAEELWPKDGLGDLFDELGDERFQGHIQLRSGVLALGLRLVLYDYACEVMEVLGRLHRNTPYVYGLCVGRTLSYAEAMVFKTLPEPSPGGSP